MSTYTVGAGLLPPLDQNFRFFGQYLGRLRLAARYDLPGNHYWRAFNRNFLPLAVEYMTQSQSFGTIYILCKHFPVDKPIVLYEVPEDRFFAQVFGVLSASLKKI